MPSYLWSLCLLCPCVAPRCPIFDVTLFTTHVPQISRLLIVGPSWCLSAWCLFFFRFLVLTRPFITFSACCGRSSPSVYLSSSCPFYYCYNQRDLCFCVGLSRDINWVPFSLHAGQLSSMVDPLGLAAATCAFRAIINAPIST